MSKKFLRFAAVALALSLPLGFTTACSSNSGGKAAFMEQYKKDNPDADETELCMAEKAYDTLGEKINPDVLKNQENQNLSHEDTMKLMSAMMECAGSGADSEGGK